MSDSLCYRLPRLFLALQDGRIHHFGAPDGRIDGMPWGWEFLALPFAAVNLLNASKLINLGAWALLFQLLFSILRKRGVDRYSARWTALAMASAPALLLQASSTASDLYAFTLLMLGIWMIFQFEQRQGPLPVMASLLSLVLASNVKPQFLVLGIPWFFWWVFHPKKPWKQTQAWLLALAFPVYYLASPFPTLTANFLNEGNIVGASAHMPPPIDILSLVFSGSIQFLAAQTQIPILPGAANLTTAVNDLSVVSELAERVPGFGPQWKPVFIVDWASFGLCHFGVILLGLFLAIRWHRKATVLWIICFASGFLIAVSQVAPTTIGRSFLGFAAVIIPMAALGIARIENPRRRLAICMSTFVVGIISLIMNPSAPLWPTELVKSLARDRGFSSVAEQVDSYQAYSVRARTGKDFLEPVPAGKSVGLMVRRITPISALWQPDWRDHRIVFVNRLTTEQFLSTNIDWLVVGDNAGEFQQTRTLRYQNLEEWNLVKTESFLHNLAQGPEIWRLYHRSIAE